MACKKCSEHREAIKAAIRQGQIRQSAVEVAKAAVTVGRKSSKILASATWSKRNPNG